MKLQPALKTTIANLLADDIIVLVGNTICKEAIKFKSNNIFYFYGPSAMGLSFSLGLAMHSSKRVFVFCSDDIIVSELNSVLQASMSGCNNLFILLFISGEYQAVGKINTLYKSIKSTYGLFFNMGILVNNYTHLFEEIKYNKNILKNMLSNIKGPLISFIEVTPGLSKDQLVLETNFENVREFING
jgi:hypothetical protein